jgi:hypothetical protein
MSFLFGASKVGIGFEPTETTVQCRVRGGAKTKGQVVQFDLRNTDPAVLDNNLDGGEDSGFGNVIVVTTPTATTPRKMYGIIRGPGDGSQAGSSIVIPDDAVANVMLYGVAQCLVFEPSSSPGTNGALAIDDDLGVINAAIVGGGGTVATGSAVAMMPIADTVTVSGGYVAGVEYPILGKCLEVVAVATSAILAKCWFWGGLPCGISQR